MLVVAHPRMHDEDDPLLARLREVALAFPEAVEVESWGRPTFRAGNKIDGSYRQVALKRMLVALVDDL